MVPWLTAASPLAHAAQGLTALTALDLSCNLGVRNLGALSRLRSLALRECELEELPQELGTLAALTSLDASGNFLKALGPLRGLTGLAELSLCDCSDLPGLPAELAALTALTSLSLAGLDTQQGWEHVAPLTGLQVLVLDRTYFPEDGEEDCLPPQLSALTALTRLSCVHDGMIAGWGVLAALPRLQELAVHGHHADAVQLAVPQAHVTRVFETGPYSP